MKKLMVLFSAVFLVSLLAACAVTGPAKDAKVKCPACGNEFNYVAPSELQ